MNLDSTLQTMLLADIDMTGLNIHNIGAQNEGEQYFGVFEGNSHIISNFSYSESGGRYLGLFAPLGQSARVQNVNLVNADLQGSQYLGGLAGQNQGLISNCSVTGSVKGLDFSSDTAGGLVGINQGTITLSHSSATVLQYFETGGLVGVNQTGATISRSYATGLVGASLTQPWLGYNHGGLTGTNYGTISNSYARGGSVDGGSDSGGLSGRNYGSIQNSYAANSKTSSLSRVGGLVGLAPAGSVNSSYWDMTLNPATGLSANGASGRTTSQMQSQSTFSGWDFYTIWQMTGYPSLR